MKKATVFTTLWFCVFSVDTAMAQEPEKRVHHREQLWVGYFNQSRLSDKFGLWLDVQHRMTDNFVDRSFQFLFRPGVTYFINDNLRVNAGYALIKQFPARGLSTIRTEHRPWQQIWWNQKYSGLTTLQWIRFEQRFNERVADDIPQGGYNYNFRLRYNLSFFVPLNEKEITLNTLFLVVANELFLNFGDRIAYNTFDQNRLFAGLGYQLTSDMNAQFGYMNVYQQDASGHNYFSSHAVRLSLFHSVDFRR